MFSPDGNHIAWAARQPGGTYLLRVAEFVATPEHHLGAIRDYRPGGAGYYETGSFTSDARALVYTSDQDSHAFYRSQIYRLDLAGGASTRLMQGDDYNEHPTDVNTPAGDRVVYMSTLGVRRFPLHRLPGTDWYVMGLDGAVQPTRLTTMNERSAGNPENLGGPRFAGTVSLSPSGNFMLGDVQDSIAKQTGRRWSCILPALDGACTISLVTCVVGETVTCTCPVLRMMATQYERLAGFGVATAFEGNGRQGLIDVDLCQIVPGSRIAGPARTVLCGQDDNLMVHAAIEHIVPGDVLVVVMPLPTVTSLMGDLLVMQAKRRGVAGIILDGAVRDTEAIRAMNVPVWSRYVRVRTAGKAIPGTLDLPVVIGGTSIAPGDAVVLDTDGAVAIAAARVEDALAACDERERKETDLRRQLDAGALTLDLNDLRRLLPG